jgi:integrase
MPNATRKLTNRLLASLKPEPTDYVVWDLSVSGFGCRVWPSGSRTFVYRYRPKGQRRKRYLTLAAGNLEVARAVAKQHAADRDKGLDPAEDKRARRERPTVADLGADYLDHARTYRKATTAVEYVRLWGKHVAPKLGRRIVADVTTADVARLHRSLSATPYLANRVLALVGAFFTFAAKQGERAKHDNPASDVEPFPEKGRETYLTVDQLAKLGAALDKAEREGLPQPPTRRRKQPTGRTAKHRAPSTAGVPQRADPNATAALRLLVLTGMRKSEVLALQWVEVDLERGALVLSDSKTGKSARVLGAEALALLASRPREGRYVFPGGLPGRPLASVRRLWDAVRHEAGVTVRLHDLRHTHAAVSATRGESLLMVGRMLGHRRADTSAKYAHLADTALRRAADETSAHIARALAGTTGTPVTPMRRRKRRA